MKYLLKGMMCLSFVSMIFSADVMADKVDKSKLGKTLKELRRGKTKKFENVCRPFITKEKVATEKDLEFCCEDNGKTMMEFAIAYGKAGENKLRDASSNFVGEQCKRGVSMKNGLPKRSKRNSPRGR